MSDAEHKPERFGNELPIKMSGCNLEHFMLCELRPKKNLKNLFVLI